MDPWSDSATVLNSNEVHEELSSDTPDELSSDMHDERSSDTHEVSIDVDKLAQKDQGEGIDDDQEGTDSDSDDGEFHWPGTNDEKRRLVDHIFEEYAAQKLEEVTEKEIREVIKGSKDEQLSIRDILAKQDNSGQIINPRDYQIELFQKAKKENIIAVLDTGSGKTHIATLLLRHILDEELAARQNGGPCKHAFFLVNSVNLVFQQSNVLQCGLDQKVLGICGAMGASLWTKKTWDKYFADNMVIVCTAEVLLQCMMHAFISMSSVNLLIFDEAHHAKSNHAYARLMKDYYLHEPDLSKRPRVFGMTASPVDANVDIKEAATQLETLLHCKIATTSDLSLLQNHITRPEESIREYDPLPVPFETPFHQDLKSRFGVDIPVFRRLFANSKLITAELGPWASDAYWSFAFSEEEGRKIELRQEREHNKVAGQSIEKLDREVALLKEAGEFVSSHDFGLPTEELLSSKVLALRYWLQKYYEKPSDTRCIVFVERRQTARLLSMIFTHLGDKKRFPRSRLQHLRCEILVGSTSRLGEERESLKSQIMTVAKFRRGELNCLFATSVAEEGLDIPQCNLVVRFDLYKTMIAYVQSRGRARHRHSKYIHMLEKGNAKHRQTLVNAHSAEAVMRAFCNGLPIDRILDDVDDSVERLLANEDDFPTYLDPASGAKLTYRSSMAVLAHFVACLPVANQEECLQPNYVVDRVGEKFICEVILPECSPVHSIQGLPQRKKAIAKCSAAFEMCLVLREKGFLDATLLPTLARQLPAMRNAQLAISSKKKGSYTMRIKPEFWKYGYDTVPEKLHLTVIDVSAGLDRPHQPIGLVTRKRFPQLPEFPIYLEDGRPSEVISIPLLSAIRVTEEKLKMFTAVTWRIFRDIFNKTFEDDPSKMSYWLVPLITEKTALITPFENPELLIDWDQVHVISEKEDHRWNSEMPNEFLPDKYIVDVYDGGRRFYSNKVVSHLKATDPVPEGSPRYKHEQHILDYSVSLFKNSRLKMDWNLSQPVLQAEKIPFRRNYLACVERDEDEIRKKQIAYVCPQPLRISTLTTPFVAMLYAFPAILHRFEAYMVALDACTLLDLKISPRLALEALTKDSENSDDHGQEQIRFKSGMGPNYERLEFMGDCFLKMATSLSTFVLQPDENEFEFHVRRMLMLCNKNLLEGALNLKLYEYVRSMAFSRRTWYPEGMALLDGKGKKKVDGKWTAIKYHLHHTLGDKSIADVCEAFIGAAFMEYNKLDEWEPSNWDAAVKAVKIMVQSEDHLMEKFSDYYAAYEKPKYQLAEATASQLDLARQIELKHPYHFQYPRLLRSAFIHPSQAFMWENIPNYQRLEFLGDSLLDQVFITHLFYRYPDKDPQWLTEHKMPMVSNKFLGALCVRLGFHKHLRQNNAALTSEIKDYVLDVEAEERDAQGSPDYWMKATHSPPKCLADIVEAYVGAMFVDSGFDFRVVQSFFDMHIKRFYEDMSLYDSFANNHPVTRLYNMLTANFGCSNFNTQSKELRPVVPGGKVRIMSMLQIHFKVWFHETADSSRYAKPKLCNTALKALEGLPPFEFRRIYGCDCGHTAGEGEGEEEEEADTRPLEERVREAVESQSALESKG